MVARRGFAVRHAARRGLARLGAVARRRAVRGRQRRRGDRGRVARAALSDRGRRGGHAARLRDVRAAAAARHGGDARDARGGDPVGVDERPRMAERMVARVCGERARAARAAAGAPHVERARVRRDVVAQPQSVAGARDVRLAVLRVDMGIPGRGRARAARAVAELGRARGRPRARVPAQRALGDRPDRDDARRAWPVCVASRRPRRLGAAGRSDRRRDPVDVHRDRDGRAAAARAADRTIAPFRVARLFSPAESCTISATC